MRDAIRCNQHALRMQFEAISMHSEAHAPIRAMPNGPLMREAISMQSERNQHAPIRAMPNGPCSCAGGDADLAPGDLAPGRIPLRRLSKAELNPDRISRASRQTARAACCTAGSGASGTRRTEMPLRDDNSTPSVLCGEAEGGSLTVIRGHQRQSEVIGGHQAAPERGRGLAPSMSSPVRLVR
jgi:hypothetical protein